MPVESEIAQAAIKDFQDSSLAKPINSLVPIKPQFGRTDFLI